jgi:hypothetical protein
VQEHREEQTSRWLLQECREKQEWQKEAQTVVAGGRSREEWRLSRTEAIARRGHGEGEPNRAQNVNPSLSGAYRMAKGGRSQTVTNR